MTKRGTTAGAPPEATSAGSTARTTARPTARPSEARAAKAAKATTEATSEAEPEATSEAESEATTEAAPTRSSARATARSTGRRFRPRTVELPEGETLTIDRDGTIRRHAPDGATTQTWPPHDAAWARVAIHFGLHASPPTVTPSGRQVRGTWPPR